MPKFRVVCPCENLLILRSIIIEAEDEEDAMIQGNEMFEDRFGQKPDTVTVTEVAEK